MTGRIDDNRQQMERESDMGQNILVRDIELRRKTGRPRLTDEERARDAQRSFPLESDAFAEAQGRAATLGMSFAMYVRQIVMKDLAKAKARREGTGND